MTPIGRPTDRPITDDMLCAPEFRRLHAFVKWGLIICMLVMIAEGTFFLPYIVARFGWG